MCVCVFLPLGLVNLGIAVAMAKLWCMAALVHYAQVGPEPLCCQLELSNAFPFRTVARQWPKSTRKKNRLGTRGVTGREFHSTLA